jgi:hypothetical protein
MSLELKHAAFRMSYRPMIEGEWQRRCRIIGRLGTREERSAFGAVFMRQFVAMAREELQKIGRGDAVEGALRVASELIDELPVSD